MWYDLWILAKSFILTEKGLKTISAAGKWIACRAEIFV